MEGCHFRIQKTETAGVYWSLLYLWTRQMALCAKFQVGYPDRPPPSFSEKWDIANGSLLLSLNRRFLFMVDWYYIFSILWWGVYPSPQSIYNVVENWHFLFPPLPWPQMRIYYLRITSEPVGTHRKRTERHQRRDFQKFKYLRPSPMDCSESALLASDQPHRHHKQFNWKA
jgi:hypothetical protein